MLITVQFRVNLMVREICKCIVESRWFTEQEWEHGPHVLLHMTDIFLLQATVPVLMAMSR